MSEQSMAVDGVLARKVTRYIEMQTEDGSWAACINPREDPAEILRIMKFRQNEYPDLQHRIVKMEVTVSLDDVEAVQEVAQQRADEEKESSVHSG